MRAARRECRAELAQEKMRRPRAWRGSGGNRAASDVRRGDQRVQWSKTKEEKEKLEREVEEAAEEEERGKRRKPGDRGKSRAKTKDGNRGK